MFQKIKKFNSAMKLPARIVYYFVLVSLLGSLAYIIVQLIMSPTVKDEAYEYVKADYLLTLIQCLGALILLQIPVVLELRFKLDVPTVMTLFFIAFLYFAVYLGECQHFYYRFAHWDTFLHGISAMMLGTLSFSIIGYLTKKSGVKLSPLLVAVFAFCFAITIGVLWEIYEFVWDMFGNFNMQKYATEDGYPFIGKFALLDTMLDLIIDTIGAAIVAVFGFISTKMERNWVDKLTIKRKSALGEPKNIIEK